MTALGLTSGAWPCWVVDAVDDRAEAHYASRGEAETTREQYGPVKRPGGGWSVSGGCAHDCFHAAGPEAWEAVAWSPPLAAPPGHSALIELGDVPLRDIGVITLQYDHPE